MKKLILLSATALACAVSFGAIRAVTPTAWNGDPNCWQMKRHAEKMAFIATNRDVQVVFIGDSITHFWETKGKAQWKKYFADGPCKVLDLGTSGDRTEHVLWRLTEGKELDGYEAKIIFLMIGTNNTGHFKFSDEPPIDTILGVREILKTIRMKQPMAKIVLTAIFPRGADTNDARRKRNETVNKEIAKFADGKSVFWLDVNDQFLTSDGRLPREVFPDLLHPGPYGYEVWASAILPYVNAALAGLPMPPSRWAPFVREENMRMDGPATVHPATRIMEDHRSRGKDWWSSRLLEKRNQIVDSKGEIDLVFFGDSITHYWEKQGAASLEELRKTYSVLDLGYGGDRTEHLVWRGLNGELDGYTAKCVMLMIGTNNHDKSQDVVAGIRRILDIIAEKQPQAKILLLPIFPRGANAENGTRKRNEAVNAEIVKFADGEKIIWVDFHEKFLDGKGDTKWCMPDRLHPNAEAYRNIWLPAVLPYFKEIVGK